MTVAVRRTGWLLLLTVLASIAIQLRPLLVYHLTVAPDLKKRGLARSLEARVLEQFGAPGADWPRLEAANFELRAPILTVGTVDDAHCRACTSHCLLRIAGGTLGVFRDSPEESLDDALDRFAPRGSEIRAWQSRARNWSILEALAGRASNPGLPESFRFNAPRSQGVVTVHAGSQGERFVVYAYSPVGTPTRVIGLASVSRTTLAQVLGTLAISDDAGEKRSARCSRGNDGRASRPLD